MNVNNYVNKIVRKIKCSTARRKEIRKQLQMDIELLYAARRITGAGYVPDGRYQGNCG